MRERVWCSGPGPGYTGYAASAALETDRQPTRVQILFAAALRDSGTPPGPGHLLFPACAVKAAHEPSLLRTGLCTRAVLFLLPRVSFIF